jgi:hypothetical protein
MKGSWPILMYYPGICLKGLRKTTKPLGYRSRKPLSEPRTSGMLISLPWLSVRLNVNFIQFRSETADFDALRLVPSRSLKESCFLFASWSFRTVWHSVCLRRASFVQSKVGTEVWLYQCDCVRQTYTDRDWWQIGRFSAALYCLRFVTLTKLWGLPSAYRPFLRPDKYGQK